MNIIIEQSPLDVVVDDGDDVSSFDDTICIEFLFLWFVINLNIWLIPNENYWIQKLEITDAIEFTLSFRVAVSTFFFQKLKTEVNVVLFLGLSFIKSSPIIIKDSSKLQYFFAIRRNRI